MKWCLLILAACSRSPAPMTPEQSDTMSTTWCVAAVATVFGGEGDWRLCGSDQWRCEAARDYLRSLSTDWVLSIGECEERP